MLELIGMFLGLNCLALLHVPKACVGVYVRGSSAGLPWPLLTKCWTSLPVRRVGPQWTRTGMGKLYSPLCPLVDPALGRAVPLQSDPKGDATPRAHNPQPQPCRYYNDGRRRPGTGGPLRTWRWRAGTTTCSWRTTRATGRTASAGSSPTETWRPTAGTRA